MSSCQGGCCLNVTPVFYFTTYDLSPFPFPHLWLAIFFTTFQQNWPTSLSQSLHLSYERNSFSLKCWQHVRPKRRNKIMVLRGVINAENYRLTFRNVNGDVISCFLKVQYENNRINRHAMRHLQWSSLAAITFFKGLFLKQKDDK
jgi:hypothetical protein